MVGRQKVLEKIPLDAGIILLKKRKDGKERCVFHFTRLFPNHATRRGTRKKPEIILSRKKRNKCRGG